MRIVCLSCEALLAEIERLREFGRNGKLIAICDECQPGLPNLLLDMINEHKQLDKTFQELIKTV